MNASSGASNHVRPRYPRRFPVGTPVQVSCDGFPPSGVVVGHGRDRGGIYTSVRFNDGTVAPFHREYLTEGAA